MPQPPEELREIFQLLGVGLVVNPVHEGLYRLVFFFLPDVLGHLPVGEQHEILNQLVGFLHLADVDADRLSLVIQVEPDLLGLEVERALLESLLPQGRGHFIEGGDFFAVLPLSRLDDGLHLFVGEPPVRMDHGFPDPGVVHRPFFIHLEHSRETKPVDSLLQRAEAI